MRKPAWPEWIKTDGISWKEDYDVDMDELVRIFGSRGRAKAYNTSKWNRRRKDNKRFLNDVYQHLRPGTLICSCGGGHTEIESLRIDVDVDTGWISRIYVVGKDSKNKTYGCLWGNCVSLRKSDGFCPDCGGLETWGNNPGQEEAKAAFDAEWGAK